MNFYNNAKSHIYKQMCDFRNKNTLSMSRETFILTKQIEILKGIRLRKVLLKLYIKTLCSSH